MGKKLINIMLMCMMVMSLFGCSKEVQKEATYEDYYGLGVMSYQNEDYDAAIAAYEQALELEMTEDAVVALFEAYAKSTDDAIAIKEKRGELLSLYGNKLGDYASLADRLEEIMNKAIRFKIASVYLREDDVIYNGIPVNQTTVGNVASTVNAEIVKCEDGTLEAVHHYGQNSYGEQMHIIISQELVNSLYPVDEVVLDPACYEFVSVDGINIGDSMESVLSKIADADLKTLKAITYCTYCDEDMTATIWVNEGHYMGRYNDLIGYSEEEENSGYYISVYLYNHNISELELRTNRIGTIANLEITFYFDDNGMLVGYDDMAYQSEYGITR